MFGAGLRSDGPQPHLVNIQFQKKMSVQELHLYLDYTLDESYSPNRIAVRAGNSFYDLEDIANMSFKEPQGWIVIPLKLSGGEKFIKASLLQIVVLSNHQNGRDTHIRQIKVFGPRTSPIRAIYGFDTMAKDVRSYALIR
ncbi:hypothetical protein BSKO_01911 [Bryopsis sp. KO-2023]|nr:hypothetical protein BSKO_01911 [Bryopsis sp. KO-2023]